MCLRLDLNSTCHRLANVTQGDSLYVNRIENSEMSDSSVASGGEAIRLIAITIVDLKRVIQLSEAVKVLQQELNKSLICSDH